MLIRSYVLSGADHAAASQLSAPAGSSYEVLTVDLTADQGLPLPVVQVMALRGAAAFPLTTVDGHVAKSGQLPAASDLGQWQRDGVSKSIAVVTEATSAVEFGGEARIHISLDVTDIEAALPFYMVLFDARPLKRKADYVKFELASPSLNITLNQHDDMHASSGHYGIQVKSSRAVDAARERLQAAGFAITDETETACCYAVQTKLWVVDPDGNRWEVFVVTEAEADEGCGPDCVCYQDLERSYVSVGSANPADAPTA